MLSNLFNTHFLIVKIPASEIWSAEYVGWIAREQKIETTINPGKVYFFTLKIYLPGISNRERAIIIFLPFRAESSLWVRIKKISLTQREFTLLFKLRTVRLFHFFIAQHLLQCSRQKHIRWSYTVRNHFFINLILLTTVKKMRAVIDCCCCYDFTIFS